MDNADLLNESPSAQRQYLQVKVFGLSLACPFDQGNPCDCPLHEIRKKKLEEKIKWLNKLSDEGVLNILTYHQICLGEKENLKK